MTILCGFVNGFGLNEFLFSALWFNKVFRFDAKKNWVFVFVISLFSLFDCDILLLKTVLHQEISILLLLKTEAFPGNALTGHVRMVWPWAV